MDYREKLLKEKAEELEKWAKENLSLKEDEFVTLTLTIEKRPIVEVKQVRVNTSRASRTNKALTEQDWETILSLPFSIKQRDIINLFKQNGNKPLLPREIEEFISESIRKYPPNAANCFSYGQLSGINSIFSRRRSPYRLLENKEEWSYHSWGELPVRMFIVK